MKKITFFNISKCLGAPAFWRQNLRCSWARNFYIWPGAYWRTILKLCYQNRLLTHQEVTEARVMWNVPCTSKLLQSQLIDLFAPISRALPRGVILQRTYERTSSHTSETKPISSAAQQTSPPIVWPAAVTTTTQRQGGRLFASHEHRPNKRRPSALAADRVCWGCVAAHTPTCDVWWRQ